MSSVVRTSVVALVAVALAGCTTLQRIGIVRSDLPGGENASTEGAPVAGQNERQRIPVLALDQALKVSDALKTQTIQLPQAAARADWPLPGGTPEQSVEHVAAGADFKIAWRRDIGKGSTRYQHITAPPIIADGRIYTMDAGAQVTAVDLATGRTVWDADLVPKTLPDGTRPRTLLPPLYIGNTPIDTITFGGGIAFADGKVYVTSGYRFVAAVDAATGQLLWRTFVDTPIHAAPTVTAGRVFAVSTDDELVTFDATTGEEGWSHQGLVEPARILQASSPAVSGDTIVASFASGEVTALRATNGNELWPANLSRVSRTTALAEIRDIPGRPVIYRGDVYAASHSGVFAAIDMRSGQPRWSLPVSSITTPWPAGDVVYIISRAGELVCASRETGQVYWIKDLNAGIKKTKDKNLFFGPVLASDKLVVVSSDGRALALNPKTGEVTKTLKLGGPALITPVAAGGMVYVVTDKAELVAIR